MNEIKTITAEDYQEIMKVLKMNSGNENQKEEFFNAWSFGQSEKAGDYVVGSQISMNEHLFSKSECS